MCRPDRPVVHVRFWLAAGLLVLALLWPAVAAAETGVDDITGMLICQCGCNMVVTTCDCGTAETMRQEIKDKLAQGQTRDQIVAYYVEAWGESILAAPTPSGFNLTAWVVPFAAIAGGGGAVFMAVRTWVARRGADDEVEEMLAEVSPVQLDEYEERLRRELEEEE